MPRSRYSLGARVAVASNPMRVRPCRIASCSAQWAGRTNWASPDNFFHDEMGGEENSGIECSPAAAHGLLRIRRTRHYAYLFRLFDRGSVDRELQNKGGPKEFRHK